MISPWFLGKPHSSSFGKMLSYKQTGWISTLQSLYKQLVGVSKTLIPASSLTARNADLIKDSFCWTFR